MLSVALRKFENIKSLQLVFLERGHTQNENDSVHSTIETSKKGISIFHPFQWITLVEASCKTAPYIIEYMETESFLNFQTTMGGEYDFLIKMPRENVILKPN